MKKLKTVEYTDEQLEEISARSMVEDATRPRAAKVVYKAGKVCVTLKSGVELRIPSEMIQGLQGATAAQLSNIQIDKHGYALFWDDLDVQMGVEGLAAGRYGTAQWMQDLPGTSAITASDLGRMGGSVKSAAKAAAGRANGQKGGRPRKVVAA